MALIKSIQSGRDQLIDIGGTMEVDITVNEINMDKAWLVVQTISDRETYDLTQLEFRLTTSTNISVKTADDTGNPSNVFANWYLVEFEEDSDITVQRGYDSAGDVTLTSAVSVSSSISEANFRATGTGIGDTKTVRSEVISTSAVRLDCGHANDISWQVIDFGSHANVQTITHVHGASDGQTFDEAISAVDIDRTFLWSGGYRSDGQNNGDDNFALSLSGDDTLHGFKYSTTNPTISATTYVVEFTSASNISVQTVSATILGTGEEDSIKKIKINNVRDFGKTLPTVASSLCQYLPVDDNNDDSGDYGIGLDFQNATTLNVERANGTVEGTFTGHVINFDTDVQPDSLSATGWNRRQTITIPSTVTSADLTGFPTVLTSANIPIEVYGYANSDGSDIRITEDANGKIEVPVEVITKEFHYCGFTEIWFRADITSASGATYYLWYDNPNATTPETTAFNGAESVWSEDYLSVFHLNEYRGDTTPFDSVGTVAGASYNNGSVSNHGIIGQGHNFNGSNGYVDLNKLYTELNNNDLTVEGWGNRITSGVAQVMISNGNATTNDSLTFGFNSSDEINFNFFNNGFTTSATFPQINEFKYLVGTYDSIIMEQSVYVDGDFTQSNTTTADLVNPVSDMNIGRRDNNNDQYWNGVIDEVRISRVKREPEWINATYSNITSAGSFSTLSNNTIFNEDNALIENGWGNFTQYRIPSSAVDETLVQYTLAITSAHDNYAIFSNSQSAGNDLRASTDNQGEHQIPIELVDFNTSASVSASSVIYVRIPILSADEDNDIFIWYNNTSASSLDTSARNGQYHTWDKNYLAVWHFNDDISTTAPQASAYLNSVSVDDYHLTSINIPSQKDGVLGKALGTNGSNEYVHTAGGLDQKLQIYMSHFSIEAWVKRDVIGTDRYVLTQGENIQHEGLQFGYEQNNFFKFGFWNNDLDSTTARTNITDWEYHFGSYWDLDKDRILYYNGQEDVRDVPGTRFTDDGGTATGDMCNIGRRGMTANNYWDGGIDEVRVSNIDRKASYVSVNYSNVTSGSAFLINIQDSVSEPEGSGNPELPQVEVSGSGYFNHDGTGILTLPEIEINGVGVFNLSGLGSVSLTTLEVSGAGTIFFTISGSGDVPLPNIETNGFGVFNLSGSGDIPLPNIEIDGVGVHSTGSVIASGAFTLPELEIDGVGEFTSTIPIPSPYDELTDFEEEDQDVWATDMSKNVLSKGEEFDEKAINLSIENILSTIIGERVFSPLFGSVLPVTVFEHLNQITAEELLNNLLDAIALWETRVVVITNEIKMNVLTQENALTLIIPYQIIRTELTGTFSKKIVL